MKIESEIEERLCDIVAAELIMPREWFDNAVKTMSLREIARLFAVSELMVCVRLMEIEAVPYRPVLYRLFDRLGFVKMQILRRRPVVIVWMPSTVQARCRFYGDVFGMSDVLGIVEIPTLFTGVKGIESLRVFKIPYLVTGYSVPPEFEEEGVEIQIWKCENDEKHDRFTCQPRWDEFNAKMDKLTFPNSQKDLALVGKDRRGKIAS